MRTVGYEQFPRGGGTPGQAGLPGAPGCQEAEDGELRARACIVSVEGRGEDWPLGIISEDLGAEGLSQVVGSWPWGD